jgi:hypothetical protein
MDLIHLTSLMSVSGDERASPFGKREPHKLLHRTNRLAFRSNFTSSRDREGDTVERVSQEGSGPAGSGSLGEAG